MGLEVGDGFISGLVASNPVGASDPKSQGDDHIRLIKTALKGTFPNLTGAVTLTQAQINDAARLSAENVFTGATQTLSSIRPSLRFTETDAAANAGKWNVEAQSGTFLIETLSDAGGSGTQLFFAVRTGNTATLAIDATTLTLKGVNVTDYPRLSASNNFTGGSQQTSVGSGNVSWSAVADDVSAILQANKASLYGLVGTVSGHDFHVITGGTARISVTGAGAVTIGGVASTDWARLSQSNTFTGVAQTVSGTSARWQCADGSVAARLMAEASSSAVEVGATSNHPAKFLTNNLNRYEISSGGNHDFKSGTATFGGAVSAPNVANSSSTTLVAGQMHFIDGDATLPNLTAGQWITVINDGASSRTISKNGSDTTYWTLTGASVSTSFTLAARGRLTAVCNPAGTSVYVSGSGITGAT